MAVRGGHKLKKFIRGAGRGGVKSIQVGFFASARYPDGTPVTNVAAWNEFGTEYGERIPERPFMRRSTKTVKAKLRAQLISGAIDTRKGIVNVTAAGRLGLVFQREIQETITKLKTPKNAPSTKRRKNRTARNKESEPNPLIDTGFMKRSVTFKVTRFGT